MPKLPENLTPASSGGNSAESACATVELRYTITVAGKTREFFVSADSLAFPAELLPHLEATVFRNLLEDEAARLSEPEP